MVSNTKLFPEQKQWVKNWVNNNPSATFFDNEKVTVMVKPEFKDSRMVIVSVSTMSPDEKRFRPSVGKYYAINNMENGQYVLMNRVTVEAFINAIW